MREQLALGEGANGVDDHLLLVGELEVHGYVLLISAVRAVSGGGRRMTLPVPGGAGQARMGGGDGGERGGDVGQDRR